MEVEAEMDLFSTRGTLALYIDRLSETDLVVTEQPESTEGVFL